MEDTETSNGEQMDLKDGVEVFKMKKMEGFLYLNEIDEERLLFSSKVDLIKILLKKLPLLKAYQVLNAMYYMDVFGHVDFKVHAILDEYVSDGKKYYQFKWKYWPAKLASFELESSINNCDEAMQLYQDWWANKRDSPYPQDESDVVSYASLMTAFDKLLKRINEDKKKQLTFDVVNQCIAKVLMNANDKKPLKFHMWLGPNCPRFHLFATESHTVLSTIPPIPTLPNDPCPNGLQRSSSVSVKSSDSGTSDIHYVKRYEYIFKFNQSNMRKEAQLEALKKLEIDLNAGWESRGLVKIENDVDLEVLANFEPIKDYVYHDNVPVPEEPGLFCECESGEVCHRNRHRTCCSASIHKQLPPYTVDKKLSKGSGKIIFECNSNCKCDQRCPFRVVQLGSKHPLTIFRTKNRGWGVKSRRYIPMGVFVMEYLGEVITFSEAERRGQDYDAEGATYLFDLDCVSVPKYTVDARHKGNIAKFINHSCDPNMILKCVVINNINLEMPRLALFTKRPINANEELTFDYQMTGVATFDESVIEEENLNSPASPVVSPKRRRTLGDFTNVQQTPPKPNESQDVNPQPTQTVPSTPDIKSKTRHPRRQCFCGSRFCRKFIY